MKISVTNLGAIKYAEFALGDLTIICGSNNTGKTYATYALFGFLSFWRDAFSIKIPDSTVTGLLNDGSIDLDIQDYIDNASNILSEGCDAFTNLLPQIFASSEKHFATSKFIVELDVSDIKPNASFERNMGTAKSQLFSITKNPIQTSFQLHYLLIKIM
jgi:hypothetical protein